MSLLDFNLENLKRVTMIHFDPELNLVSFFADWGPLNTGSAPRINMQGLHCSVTGSDALSDDKATCLEEELYICCAFLRAITSQSFQTPEEAGYERSQSSNNLNKQFVRADVIPKMNWKKKAVGRTDHPYSGSGS